MPTYKDFISQTFPKIVCVGKNYLKHVKQMGGNQIPETPVLFQKPWSSLIHNPKSLSLPIAKTHRVDHQIQLGVFIKKGGKNISVETANQHIGGYFLALDLTDRNLQGTAKQKGFPWCIPKGQDQFCPVTDLFEGQVDPYSIQLEMIVNGQVRQKDLTSNMHFKVNQVISYLTQFMTLNEGDLILTGTPDGVGPLVHGDKVQAFARVKDRVLAKLQFNVGTD